MGEGRKKEADCFVPFIAEKNATVAALILINDSEKNRFEFIYFYHCDGPEIKISLKRKKEKLEILQFGNNSSWI